jgi:AraC-like DNA-binding protein
MDKYFAPRLALASCMRAFIVRNTLGRPLLPEAARFNHFPATPLCSLTWIISGYSERVGAQPGTAVAGPDNPVIFGGPQTGPTVTYNRGLVHMFMVMLCPPAVHRLTGKPVSDHLDRFRPASEVFGPAVMEVLDAVLAMPDDASRVRLLEERLGALWLDGCARDGADVASAGDWLKGLAVQLAASGLGNGIRNVQRRIKAWTGQPMGRLRRLTRAEQAYLAARDEMHAGSVDWSDVVAEGGYADQAHLCREAKEISGLTPTELARAGAKDERYWIYRIWS